MDAKQAILGGLDVAEMVGLAYLTDLTDDEFMQRPHPRCNHINWQVGHLIATEHQWVDGIRPGAMPPLPAGFAEKYVKDTASSNDPSQFATKDQLLDTYRSQRAGTRQLVESLSPEDLDQPSGISFAPTWGALIRMNADHWLMHCGQWVIVRRENDKPVVI